MNTNKLSNVMSMETINSTRKNKSLQKQFKFALKSVRVKLPEPLELKTADITLLATLSQESAATLESKSCRSLFEELLDDYYLETISDPKNDHSSRKYTHHDLKEDFVYYLQSLRPEPSVASDDSIADSSYDESDDLKEATYQLTQPHISTSSGADSRKRKPLPAPPSVHLEGKETLTDEDDWDSSSVPTIDDDECSNKSSRSGGVYYHEIFPSKDLGFKGKGKLNHFPYNHTSSLDHLKSTQMRRTIDEPRLASYKYGY